MKKWFITFTTDSEHSLGYALVVANNPTAAAKTLKYNSSVFGDDTIILSVKPIEDYTLPCKVLPNTILAEGINRSEGTYIPIVNEDGTIYFKNNITNEVTPPVSIKGAKGDKGDAFTYEDFTEEQLEGLKGPKGDAFVYSDFTPEQLEALRGPRGEATTVTESKYTLQEYLILKQNNLLQNIFYPIYDNQTNTVLQKIYLGNTLFAKKAEDGETVTTGCTFPLILPIIFA